MEIDNSGADASAKNITKKKRDTEIEEQRLQLELARAARERQKAVEAEREKGERELVEISSAANNQMDTLKKLNSERVRSLNDNTQKHYLTLATSTADELKRADGESLKAIQNQKLSSLEKIKNVTDRSQDPFYQMKSLSPVLSEAESNYTIKMNMAEHEAKNLLVTGEGQYVKLSLSRRFQDDVKDPEQARHTKTNSFQSVSEQLAIPGAFEGKKISREFKDGVMTIVIPKVKFAANEPAKS